VRDLAGVAQVIWMDRTGSPMTLLQALLGERPSEDDKQVLAGIEL
jgi:hypothetical protein